MATLDWQLRRTGEVTLVELSVRSDRDQQVRIESRLTPVWPPRQQGVPVRGWQGNAFEGTVEAGRPLVVGYASPAEPAEPPAAIMETGSPADDSMVTPHRLVRTLGDARPPRDVLREPEETDSGTVDATAVRDDERVHGQPRETAHSRATGQPAEPTAWFEAVESRLATTQQLAEATDADEIRAAVDSVGGIEEVRSLQAQLDADRRLLREIRRQSETLAAELSTVELPLATLERVV